MSAASSRVPAIEGWFTVDTGQPHLLGACCRKCGTYFFPKLATYCRNPACDSSEFDEVRLSRTGTIWSYTNACYQPPEPFVAPDPYVPFAIAAVRLDKERMIVLGQVAGGVGVDSLRIGMPVELVLKTLYRDGEQDKVVWKWRPLPDVASGGSTAGRRS